MYCAPCVQGRFKEIEGDDSTCLRCPALSTTARPAATTSSLCTCEDGYYDRRKRNVSCEHEHALQVECKSVDYENPCVVCPPCALCLVNKTTGKNVVMPRPGYWQARASWSHARMYKCPIAGCNCSRNGSATTGCRGGCAAGYTGVGCAVCSKMYTQVNGKCEECTSAKMALALLGLLLALALLALAAWPWREKRVGSLAAISLSCMQSLSLCAMTTPWTSPAQSLFVALRVSLLADLGALDCAVPVPFPYVWVSQFVVICALLAASAAPMWRSSVTAIASRTAFFLFPGACLNALKLFDCPVFKAGGSIEQRLLFEQSSWDCSTPIHTRIQTVAVFFLVVLAIVLPVVVLSKVRRYTPEGTPDRLLRRLKHMFNTPTWQTQIFNWHLVTMARQLCLCACIVALREFPMERTLSVWLTLIFWWAMHTTCSMFGTSSEMIVETIFNSVTLLTAVCATAAVGAGSTEGWLQPVTYMVVGACTVALSSAVVALVEARCGCCKGRQVRPSKRKESKRLSHMMDQFVAYNPTASEQLLEKEEVPSEVPSPPVREDLETQAGKLKQLEQDCVTRAQGIAALQARRRAMRERMLAARVDTLQKGSVLSSVINKCNDFSDEARMVEGWIDSINAEIKVLTSAASRIIPSMLEDEKDSRDAQPPRADAKTVAGIKVMAICMHMHAVSEKTEAYIASLSPNFWFMVPADNDHSRFYRRCRLDAKEGRLSLAAGAVDNAGADRLFGELCGDDDVVELTEYLHWYGRYREQNKESSARSWGTVVESAKSLFEQYDLDKSLTLGKFEFRGFFNGVCAMGDVQSLVASNVAQNIFKEIDTNADGSVTFDEFWKWANKEEEPRSHDSSDVYSRVRARFNEHDDGNDGLLHMSEFVSFFEGLKMA